VTRAVEQEERRGVLNGEEDRGVEQSRRSVRLNPDGERYVGYLTGQAFFVRALLSF